MNPLRARIEYMFLAFGAWKLRWLPLWLARRTAGTIGWMAAVILGIRREVAIDNLKSAFPEWEESQYRRTYIRCWQHFLRVWAELSRLPRMNRKFIEKWMSIEGVDTLREALAEGKGVIAVSGHLGNWEWTGASLSAIGLPVTCVVTGQTNRLVEVWIDRMRQSIGSEIVRRKDAVKGVLSALKRNRIVAILCDQDASESGVFVPFFGRLASTPRGPAVFHLKTGVPLVFTASSVGNDGRYKVSFKRLTFDNLSGDREQDEEQIMSKITSLLEAEVRKHPEQWLWLHRRWKSSPTAD